MIELNIQISKKKYSVSFTNKSFWCIAVLQLPLLYWKSEILQISRQSKHVDVTIVQTQYSRNTMNFVYAFRNMWEFKVSKVHLLGTLWSIILFFELKQKILSWWSIIFTSPLNKTKNHLIHYRDIHVATQTFTPFYSRLQWLINAV